MLRKYSAALCAHPIRYLPTSDDPELLLAYRVIPPRPPPPSSNVLHEVAILIVQGYNETMEKYAEAVRTHEITRFLGVAARPARTLSASGARRAAAGLAAAARPETAPAAARRAPPSPRECAFCGTPFHESGDGRARSPAASRCGFCQSATPAARGPSCSPPRAAAS